MKPMLASPVKDATSLSYPLFVSPKLDGIRVIIVDGVVLSRALKPIPNSYIQSLFGHREYDGVDGELIVGSPTENNTFNTTTSVVMSHSVDPDTKGGVVLYAFDDFSFPSDPYVLRMKRLRERLKTISAIKGLDDYEVNSPEELLAKHTEYLLGGYEGTMVRSPDGEYKYGRSTLKQGWLLKLKDFDDAEGTVVGIVELMHNDNDATVNALGRTERSTKKDGKRGSGNMMGTLVVETVWNGETVILEIGTGFTEQDRKEVWANQEDWIGQTVKYKFQRHGSLHKPRLPVYLGVRDSRDIS